MLYLLTLEELLDRQSLRGIKAKHTPYELTKDRWEKNPEHEEEVILLEYFHTYSDSIVSEGVVFMRSDNTIGRDGLDSFIVIAT